MKDTCLGDSGSPLMVVHGSTFKSALFPRDLDVDSKDIQESMLECRNILIGSRKLRAIGMEELTITEIVLKQDRIKRQGKSVKIRENLIMYAHNHLD